MQRVWSVSWAVCAACAFACVRVCAAEAAKPFSPVVVQALSPTGLRISVPDTPGMDVVVINANINIPISEKETGKLSGSVLTAESGYWTLEAKDIQAKPGDVVFYWIYKSSGSSGGTTTTGHHPIQELSDPNCRPSPTTVNGRPACAGQLIFEDNFDTLNTSIWKHMIQFSDDPDIDFATYGTDPTNSFVQDGKLHIKATVLDSNELLEPTKLDGCTWRRSGGQYCERQPAGWNVLPPTRSAMLFTRGLFTFKYGRLEARLKAAEGDWLLSRLFLEPASNAYGRHPFESGRLEAVRVRGNAALRDPNAISFGAFRNDAQITVATCARVLSFFQPCTAADQTLLSQRFHVFSATWTPQYISIKLDNCDHTLSPKEGFLQHGHFRHCTNSEWRRGTPLAPFDQEFFLQLGLLPGGFHLYSDGSDSNGETKPYRDNDPKAFLNFWKQKATWFPTWKSDMEVDYVKIWAL